MSLSIAPLPLSIAKSRPADWLRRVYAVGLIALAISGWSPVLWNRVQSSVVKTQDSIEKTIDVRQVQRASFEASATNAEVIRANVIQ